MDQSHKYEEQLTKLLEGEAHSLLLLSLIHISEPTRRS